MTGKGQFISAVIIIFVAVFLSLMFVVSGATDAFKNIFAPLSENDALKMRLEANEKRIAKLEETSDSELPTDSEDAPENNSATNLKTLYSRIDALETHNRMLEKQLEALTKQISNSNVNSSTSSNSNPTVPATNFKIDKDFEKYWRQMYEKKKAEEKLAAKLAKLKKLREEVAKNKKANEVNIPKRLSYMKRWLKIDDSQFRTVTSIIVNARNELEDLRIRALEQDWDNKRLAEESKKSVDYALNQIQSILSDNQYKRASQTLKYYLSNKRYYPYPYKRQ